MATSNRPMPITSRWARQKHFLIVLWQSRYLHLLLLPAVAYVLVFSYAPMYGVQVAFKDFSIRKGIWGSQWVGLKHFMLFFRSIYFGRLIRNTVFISLSSVVFSFPVPILFALLLNEVRNKRFRAAVQTVSYYPHFVSVVIVVGIMRTMLNPETGILNSLIVRLGGQAIPFMETARWFRTLYIGSGYVAYNSNATGIGQVYLAELDPQLLARMAQARPL